MERLRKRKNKMSKELDSQYLKIEKINKKLNLRMPKKYKTKKRKPKSHNQKVHQILHLRLRIHPHRHQSHKMNKKR